jgi:hypothetical protein
MDVATNYHVNTSWLVQWLVAPTIGSKFIGTKKSIQNEGKSNEKKRNELNWNALLDETVKIYFTKRKSKKCFRTSIFFYSVLTRWKWMEATSRKGRRKEMITEKLKKRNSKVKIWGSKEENQFLLCHCLISISWRKDLCHLKLLELFICKNYRAFKNVWWAWLGQLSNRRYPSWTGSSVNYFFCRDSSFRTDQPGFSSFS